MKVDLTGIVNEKPKVDLTGIADSNKVDLTGIVDTPSKKERIDLSGISDLSGVQGLKGVPVAPGMPTSVEEMGSPEPLGGAVGLAEAVPAMVTGFPSMFVGTIANPMNAAINALKGSPEPWYEAVRQTDDFLSNFTYSPHTKQGQAATKGLTYGSVAAFAPYLLPSLGAGEALDSETAKKYLSREQIAMLKSINNVLMLGAGAVGTRISGARSAAKEMAARKVPGTETPEQLGFEKSSGRRYGMTHPDWFEGMEASEVAKATGRKIESYDVLRELDREASLRAETARNNAIAEKFGDEFNWYHRKATERGIPSDQIYHSINEWYDNVKLPEIKRLEMAGVSQEGKRVPSLSQFDESARKNIVSEQRWEAAKKAFREKQQEAEKEVPRGSIEEKVESKQQVLTPEVKQEESLFDSVKAAFNKTKDLPSTPEVQTLQMNPFFLPEKVQAGLRILGDKMKASAPVDSLARVFAPTTRTPEAYTMGTVLSGELARGIRDVDVFSRRIGKYEKLFLSMTRQEAIDFMHRADNRIKQPTAELQAADDVFHEAFRRVTEEIQGLETGALENARESWFPRVVKHSKEGDAKLAAISKKSFSGPEGFRKKRTFDTIYDLHNAGYELVSYNPIDLAMIRMIEMSRYKSAVKAAQLAEQAGYISDKPGESGSWKKLNDKTFKRYQWTQTKDGQPLLNTTYKYARDDVAQVINNFLSSDLYNNPYVGWAYKPWMRGANALNQAQLGAGSFFHGGFTAAETVISSNAIALKKLINNGDVMGAIESSATSPAQVVANPLRGDALLKEWYEPGYARQKFGPDKGAKIEKIVQGIELAGGRPHQPKWDNFIYDDWKKMQKEWSEGGIKGKAKSIALAPTAVLEQMAKPILEQLVPRQKFGVFGELMSDWLDRNPNASTAEFQVAARQFWNRVDARLGQVLYDRIFMHNAAKNIVQAITRAPGWTGGTITEVGGGLKDLGNLISDLSAGKRPKLTDRAAYTASMLITTMAVNAALTKAFTGGDELTWADYFAFRTGKKDKNGKPERFMLPTYGKDVYAYGRDPLSTLSHKTHPMLSMTFDLAANRDYFGTQIRDESSSFIKKRLSDAGYIAEQFVPFWMRGAAETIKDTSGELSPKSALKSLKESPARTLAPQIGIMPAPSYYNATDAETFLHQKSPKVEKTQEQQKHIDDKKKIDSAYRKDPALAYQLLESSSLSDKQKENWLREKDMTSLQRLVKHGKILDSIEAFGMMTRDERRSTIYFLNEKFQNAGNTHSEAEMKKIEEKWAEVSRKIPDDEYNELRSILEGASGEEE